MYPTDRNSVLGAGYVFFDEYVEASAQYMGELYLANTPSVAMQIAAGGNVKDYDADGSVASLIFDVDTMIDRGLTFTLKHMAASSFALFLPGDVSSNAATTGALTGQVVNGGKGVTQGYWYQLGADLYPGGIRAVTSVTIKDAVPTTYDITDDYLLDLTLARVYIVPGGGIANGTVLLGGFTKTDVDWEQIAAGRTLSTKRGRLRLIAANTAGTNRDLFIPDGILTPNGDYTWKSRDTVAQMGFTLRIQHPAELGPDGNALSPIYINGRPS
jgi:hypothetical protein